NRCARDRSQGAAAGRGRAPSVCAPQYLRDAADRTRRAADGGECCRLALRQARIRAPSEELFGDSRPYRRTADRRGGTDRLGAIDVTRLVGARTALRELSRDDAEIVA